MKMSKTKLAKMGIGTKAPAIDNDDTNGMTDPTTGKKMTGKAMHHATLKKLWTPKTQSGSKKPNPTKAT